MEAHCCQQESAAVMDGAPDSPHEGSPPDGGAVDGGGGKHLPHVLSDPASPSHHVSYALSQLAFASRTPAFIRDLRAFHAHLLVPPLVQVLCVFDDDPLTRQIIDLISGLCAAGDPACISGDFVTRIASLPVALPWSSRFMDTQ